eukprot:TRINITY_DN6412_c0_g1_i1.p1 TRINITY_DN6412_c0_g1~~TRINITY_DN6412_c0_g1_i1.p1  ORF type:complete len:571 (-),score=95.62 TRINITY_DN6412_c0_g1_i1:43-1755(-)
MCIRDRVGNMPTGLPPIWARKKEDVDIAGNGGLTQGFTAFIPSKELVENLKGCDPTVPSLILAVVGGEYKDHVTYESTAQLISNIFDCLRKSLSPGTRHFVAFPTFAIGKGGHKKDRLPILTSQIKAMNQNYQNNPNIVPILVTYSDTTHRLALEARSRVLGGRLYPKVFSRVKDMVFIPELQSELASDRLTFFLGAGISMSSGLPSWSALTESMAASAGIKSLVVSSSNTSDSLLELGDMVRNQLGSSFGSVLKESLGFKQESFPRPSLTHYLITSLPTKTIVTTNYDNLLEQSLRSIKKAVFTINTPPDVAKTPIGEQVNVLKIHGDINLPDQVVFSKQDYDNYFEKRPAVSTLLKGLLLNRTFLFIGYSLRDINLHIILNEVSAMLKSARRPAYAIVFDADEAEIQSWEKRGIRLLVLNGNNPTEKSISLWQCLDTLQLVHFAPQGAWLAEDSYDLMPESDSNFTTILHKLRKTILDLVSCWETTKSDEFTEFLFPWMMLSAKHGLLIKASTWEQLAEIFNKRPKIEMNQIARLTATIGALQASDGKYENQYRENIEWIEKELFSKA